MRPVRVRPRWRRSQVLWLVLVPPPIDLGRLRLTRPWCSEHESPSPARAKAPLGDQPGSGPSSSYSASVAMPGQCRATRSACRARNRAEARRISPLQVHRLWPRWSAAADMCRTFIRPYPDRGQPSEGAERKAARARRKRRRRRSPPGRAVAAPWEHSNVIYDSFLCRQTLNSYTSMLYL